MVEIWSAYTWKTKHMNLKAPQRSVLRRQHNSCESRTEQTLPRFFHLSIKHSKRILIDIAGKRAKILLHKVANFTDVCVIGAPTCPPPPHHTMVPRNSTPGGFGYIWQSKWVGVIAIKTEITQIRFLSDFPVAVALSLITYASCIEPWIWAVGNL